MFRGIAHRSQKANKKIFRLNFCFNHPPTAGCGTTGVRRCGQTGQKWNFFRISTPPSSAGNEATRACYTSKESGRSQVSDFFFWFLWIGPFFAELWTKTCEVSDFRWNEASTDRRSWPKMSFSHISLARCRKCFKIELGLPLGITEAPSNSQNDRMPKTRDMVDHHFSFYIIKEKKIPAAHQRWVQITRGFE